MSVYYLDEAIRKLRAVGARCDPQYFQTIELWRGMQDITILDEFRRKGGTEMVPPRTYTEPGLRPHPLIPFGS